MTAQVDILEFNKSMARIAYDTGILADEILMDNAALMCADLIRSTPPSKIYAGGKGSEFEAKKHMESKIESDIRSLFYGIDGGFNKAVIGRAFAEGKAYSLFRDNRGVISLADERKLDPDGGSLADIHLKSRGKGGNVFPSAKKEASGRRVTLQLKNIKKRASGYSVGKSLWLTQKVLTKATVLRRFVREKFSHMGKTKAGWLPAFNEAMKYAITAKYRPASWITRHSGEGSFHLELPSASSYGYFEATNSVPWISKTKVSSMVNSILNTRARDFQRGFYAKRLQSVIDKRRANSRN